MTSITETLAAGADYHLSKPLQAVKTRFESHMTAGGADFVRPMRVNLLRKR